jgi:hypothetical protein
VVANCEKKKILIVTKGQARLASVAFPDERGVPKLAELRQPGM